MKLTHCGILLVALFFVPLSACGPKSEGNKTSPQGSETLHTSSPETNINYPPPAAGVIHKAMADDPMGVSIHRLSNGLKVYISTDRTTPSISTRIAVRAGSRNDPANSTGLAHYLEHMLFKGSATLGALDFEKEKIHLDNIAKLYNDLRDTQDPDKRKKILANIDSETQASSQYSVPNEFDNLYATLGIDGVNAYTSNEQTVYIATVPSNRFETWTEVEGDRFANPQFRLFYPELESVYEEKNKSLDAPDSRMYHALALALFPQHPYGTQPTIGTSEHLKTPAYADMAKYFDDWYRPNNMAIILAGDIDAKRALPALEKAFAKLKAKALPALPTYSVAPSTKRIEATIIAPGEQSLFIAWPTVAVGHPDEAVLKAMDLVVDNAKTGLLNIDLLLSQKLPQAGSFPENLKEAGMWVMSGTARDGQSLAEVEGLLLGVVKKLKEGAFSQSDLDAIVLNSQISDKMSLEFNGARVGRMTEAFIHNQKWSDVVKKQEQLKAVKREDIMRVAQTYLGNAPAVIQRKQGTFSAQKVEKPSITAIKIDSNKISPIAKKWKESPVTALEPQWLVEGQHYQRSATPAGDYIGVTNQRNDLFTINYDFDMGSLQAPMLCFALQLVERGGSGQKNATELQKALYAMGTKISFYCNTRESGINIEGIDHNMEASLALLKEWLAQTKLDNDTLAKLKANTMSQRKDTMAEPRAIASALTSYALFGKNSRYLKAPSNRKLKAAQSAALLRLTTKLPNYTHRTSYYGPRSPETVRALIALGEKHTAPKKAKATQYNKQKRPTLFFVQQETAQAQVRVAFPAAPVSANEEIHGEIFNQYVGGGMGGLIFQEIREARGLAYSAWTYFDNGSRKNDQTAIIAGLGTQADKTSAAMQTLLNIVVPLKAEESRFRTAQTSVEASYRKERISPRSRARTVFAWNARGFTSDPRPTRFEALQKASMADMQNFSDNRTKVPAIFALSGDGRRMDLKDVQKAIGLVKLKTMRIRQLFSY